MQKPLKLGSSGLFSVFSRDEVSQGRRRCYAILVRQSRLRTGTSDGSEY